MQTVKVGFSYNGDDCGNYTAVLEGSRLHSFQSVDEPVYARDRSNKVDVVSASHGKLSMSCAGWADTVDGTLVLEFVAGNEEFEAALETGVLELEVHFREETPCTEMPPIEWDGLL